MEDLVQENSLILSINLKKTESRPVLRFLVFTTGLYRFVSFTARRAAREGLSGMH